MTGTALLILQIAQAVVAAAKSDAMAEVVKSLKDFITGLVKGGVIPAEQQDALHAYVDSVALLVRQGIIPPHWQVEPDPV